MEQSESKTAGVCKQAATWKQTVNAGHQERGRFLYNSYWCDAHAQIIVQKRRRDHLTPPTMMRLVIETA